MNLDEKIMDSILYRQTKKQAQYGLMAFYSRTSEKEDQIGIGCIKFQPSLTKNILQ